MIFKKLCSACFISVLVFTVFSAQAEKITLRENESRNVDYLQLKNGLRVLLIQDEKATKAAVSLDVYVGSGEDPMEFQGLAHFLEHMLFLGSKKFPKVDEFGDFVAGHGGSHNAFTSLKHTNYFFDVDANHLAGALDRFSSMISQPLLDSKYIEREINAVHSEFTSRFKNEFRRQRDVMRELIPVGHPLSRFPTGNLDTLNREDKKELRKALVDFYQKYYHTGNMALVVNSPLPYKESRELVESLFANLKKDKKTDYTSHRSLFEKDLLPSRVFLQPNKEIRSLTMMFPLVSEKNDLYQKPLNYIGHIIGHEGKGSLLSELKALGWATGLSAGKSFEWRGGEAFSVTIQLTEKGSDKIEQIETRVLNRIDLIKTRGVDKWRYRELKDIAKINFEFADAISATREVTFLASNLQEYKPKDVFVAHYKYAKFSAKSILSKLDALTSKNLISFVTLPDVETDKISAIYDVPYRVEKLAEPIEVVSDFYKGDALPRRNSFIPTNFDVVAEKTEAKANQKTPILVSTSANSSGWYALDREFETPKLVVRARYSVPSSAGSVEGFVHTHLLAKILREQLNEIAYEALLSGLSYKINANSRGLSFEFKGYSDSLPRLISYVIEQIERYSTDTQFQARVNDAHFNEVYEKQLRDSKNRLQSSPSSRLFDDLPSLLYSPYWPANDVLAAVEKTSRKAYENTMQRFWQGGKVKSLVFGNIDESGAKDIVQNLTKLAIKPENNDVNIPPGKVVKLGEGSGRRLKFVESEEDDIAFVLYIQGKDDSYHSAATVMMVEQIVSSPFFTSLRTEQQLGYIVQTSNYSIKDVPGMIALVQSPTASGAEILRSVDAFFFGFEQKLFANFDRDKQALITSLSQPLKNQSEQASEYWSNIVADKPDFDERIQLIRAVEALTEEEIREFYKDVLLNHDRSLLLVAKNTVEDRKSTLKGIPQVQGYEALKFVSDFYIYP